MAEQGKDFTLFESLLSAAQVPSQLVSVPFVQALEGKEEPNAYSRILSGEDVIPASRIRKLILPFTDKPEEQKNFLDHTTDFVADVAIDFARDPNVFGVAGKLAGKLAESKGIVGPLKKAIEHAATGATIGALSADPNDDFLDRASKVVLGTVAGGAAAPVLKTVGEAASNLGVHAIDSLVEGSSKQRFIDFKRIKEERIKPLIDALLKKDILDESGKPFNPRSRAYRDNYIEIKDTLLDPETLKYSSLKRIDKIADEKTLPYKRKFLDKTRAVDEFLVDRATKAGYNEDQIGQAFVDFDKGKALAFGDTIAIRNDIFKTLREEHPTKSSIDLFNQATDIAEAKVDEDLLKYVKGNELVKDALVKHAEKNIQLVNDFNKVNPKLRFKPLKYHTTDLANIKDSLDRRMLTDKFKPAKAGAFLRTREVLKEGAEGVTRKDIANLGAERYANLFLDENEKEARMMIAALSKDTKGASLYKGLTEKNFPMALRGTLKHYDNFISSIKTMQLAASSGWIINNLMDNIPRAYLANGLDNAGEVGYESLKGLATTVPQVADDLINLVSGRKLLTMEERAKSLKNLSTGALTKDFYNMFDPTSTGKIVDYTEDMYKLAADSGAIESNLFKSLNDLKDNHLEVLRARLGDKELSNFINNKTKTDKIWDTIKKGESGLWKTTGRLGASIETTARFVTFKNVLKSLAKDHPEILEAIKNKKAYEGYKSIKGFSDIVDEASRITNNSFIDYNNVNLFEEEVMKRVVPYWTFFSRNFNFWVDKTFDPNTVGKVMNVLKVPANIGRRPTQNERASIPDYLLKEGARITGKDDSVTTIPNMSILDVVKSFPILGDSIKETINKTSPLVKLPYEMGYNKNLGTDLPIYPDDKNPISRVYESYPTLLPEDLLNKVGIGVDNEGKRITNKPSTAIALHALRQIVPIPILDQIARGIKSNKYDNLSPLDSLIQEVGPVKSKNISAKEAKKARETSDRNIKKYSEDDILKLIQQRKSRRKR